MQAHFADLCQRFGVECTTVVPWYWIDCYRRDEQLSGFMTNDCFIEGVHGPSLEAGWMPVHPGTT